MINSQDCLQVFLQSQLLFGGHLLCTSIWLHTSHNWLICVTQSPVKYYFLHFANGKMSVREIETACLRPESRLQTIDLLKVVALHAITSFLWLPVVSALWDPSLWNDWFIPLLRQTFQITSCRQNLRYEMFNYIHHMLGFPCASCDPSLSLL